MIVVHWIPAICVSVALVQFINKRRKVTLNCHEIMSRLHPHQLRNKDRYLGDDGKPDDEIHAATDGYVGLWRRWRNRVVLLRLCQMRYQQNAVPQAELDQLMLSASSLTYLTLKAAALATIRQYAPEKARQASFAAFHLYGSIADHTHFLFDSPSEQRCAMSLGSLL